jgi:hypothetical protein
MTPEQINEALDEILSNIADAHILIRRLENALEAAAKATKANDIDVVYGDIWTDAGLGPMRKSLRLMEGQLARAQSITLPEHYERLRTDAKAIPTDGSCFDCGSGPCNMNCGPEVSA